MSRNCRQTAIYCFFSAIIMMAGTVVQPIMDGVFGAFSIALCVVAFLSALCATALALRSAEWARKEGREQGEAFGRQEEFKKYGGRPIVKDKLPLGDFERIAILGNDPFNKVTIVEWGQGGTFMIWGTDHPKKFRRRQPTGAIETEEITSASDWAKGIDEPEEDALFCGPPVD